MINLFFVIHDYSGARTYTDELLGYLSAREGIAVYKVYLESNTYKEYTEVKEGNMIDIHIPRIAQSNNNYRKYIIRCVDLIYPFISKKTNVVFHLNRNSQINLATEVNRRIQCKIVYTLHYLPSSFYSFDSNDVYSEKISAFADEFNRQIVAEADHIICVTHFAKNMMNFHYAFPHNKMTVIYNGYSNQKGNIDENNNKDSFKKQFGFLNDDHIILFVGRIQEGKGIEKLIEAFKQLTNDYENLQLILVGKGELEPFMEQVQDNFGRVSFTGKLTAEQVKQLYQIANIGVIPSEFEQCSYVALEMMQHGLPIVCSDAPGLKELFINEENSLIAPLQARTNGLLGLEITSQGLYKAIKRLLTDRVLARKLSQNVYNNWQNHYTAAHMGQATMQVYQQLLSTDIQIPKLLDIQIFKHETI